MMILYNTRLIYVGLNEGKIWMLVLLSLFCVVIGAIITFVFAKRVQQHLAQILGATLGVCVTLFILYPTGILTVVKYVLYAVVGIICFFLFKIIEKPVIVVGTAALGSIMTFHGLSQFTGRVMESNLTMKDHFYSNPLFWLYVVGIILITIGGSLIQWKYVPHKEPREKCDLGKSLTNTPIFGL